MTSTLLTSIDGPVARITFNRPEVRNAVNAEMLIAMREFLKHIERDTSVRCIVITGAGDHFMAGGDVGGFKATLEMSKEERQREFEARVQQHAGLFALLARVPQPVIASIRGATAGAALGFVAGADFAICESSSIFILAHVKIGASPDGSSSYYLPRVLGVRKAKELAILGDKLTAQDALDFGLVNWVVPDGEVPAATEKLVKKIIDAPRVSVQWAKKLMNESLTNSLQQQVQLEAEGFAAAAGTDDFAEGVSAFMEKRAAKFNQAK
ncbi:MAG: enoyl-CoA hydratase-related protein [Steroidobacteraceae bacterium]